MIATGRTDSENRKVPHQSKTNALESTSSERMLGVTGMIRPLDANRTL